MLTASSSSTARVARGPPARDAVHHQRLLDLVADGEDRVERGHRLLEDQRDLGAADLLHLALVQRQQVASLEDDPAAGDPPGPLHQPQDRQRRHRLAAARLADEAQRFARVDVEADVDHRRGDAAGEVEHGVRCSTRAGWRCEVGGRASPPTPTSDLRPRPRISGIDLPVLAEHGAHRVRDLADGRVRLDGAGRSAAPGCRSRAPRPTRRRAPRATPAGRATRAPARTRSTCARLDRRIDLQRLDPPSPLRGFASGLRLVVGDPRIAVDADDDGLAGVDALLRAVGGVLDLALDEARLDRRQRAAEAVDPVDQRRAPRARSDPSAPRSA